MTASDFYEVFFENLPLFLFCMVAATSLLFFSARHVAVAGYLDPIHFYWTFTFGSAYGVVLGLYVLNYVSDRHFWIVAGYGALFWLFFLFFFRFPVHGLRLVFTNLLVPTSNQKHCIRLIALIFVALIIFTANSTGIGMFAELNRFEQNRGFGAFVRILDALRLFFIAYLGVSVIKAVGAVGWSANRVLCLLLLCLIIAVSSAINGAKFALLEALYAIFVANAVFVARKPKFSVGIAVVVFFGSLCFALGTLAVNLSKAEIGGDAEPRYIEGGNFVVERLVLRVLGNADKYYLGLPGDVIDHIKTDSLAVRLISPIVGVTSMSSWLGYDVDDYTVGKQILLYHDPEQSQAGGPTSHFDLFAYKYIGAEFGWLGVLFFSFVLASIASLAKCSGDNVYAASIVAALWLRALPIILEPPMGFAYILDIILIFSVIKAVSVIVPRKQALVSGS